MPPYRNPDPNAYGHVKFIRLEGDIFVGERLDQGHIKIAEMDHLEERIAKLRTTDPAQIDAGFLRIEEDELTVYKDSEMLELPVRGHEEEAREITLQTFEQQTHGRTVRESKF